MNMTYGHRTSPRHALAGDLVWLAGRWVRVNAILTYSPGQHPHSPVSNRKVARELITSTGSRWTGC